MVQLSDMAVVLSGISPSVVKDGPACFVQIKDMTEPRRSLVRGTRPTATRATPIQMGDLLVAARGGGLLAARPDEELVGAFAALDVYLVRPDNTVLDPGYLAAFINHGPGADELVSAATGGTLPRIPKESLEHLDVPMVPLEVQRRIGALDATRLLYISLIDKRMNAERRLLDGIVRKAVNQAR